MLDYYAYMDAWNRRDVATVLGFMSPDIVYHDYAIHEEYRGHDGVTQFIVAADDIASNFRFDPISFVTDGKCWASEYTISGVADVGRSKVPATGQAFKVRGASFGTLDADGRILTNNDYWNLFDMMMQVGMLPPPATP